MWIFSCSTCALFLDGIEPVINPDVFTVCPGGNTVVHADTEDCRPHCGTFGTHYYFPPTGFLCDAAKTGGDREVCCPPLRYYLKTELVDDAETVRVELLA
jgi:hypothetical protein